jgi:tRNA (guanine-N7-)-methyltransferase
VRQHVNPLSRKYQQPFTAPDWSNIYANLSLPLHLDLGCARGRFLLEMAQIQPEINFLGVEIRQSLVTEANQLRDEYKLTNLHYLFANINNSLEILLQSLPQNSLELIMIQFPDPWFKKKHHKRRLIQPELVKIFAQYLPEDSKIFIQSDVKEVAEEICDRFLENPNFQPLSREIWLEKNPLPVQTEREIATLNKGEPVYRNMLIKS